MRFESESELFWNSFFTCFIHIMGIVQFELYALMLFQWRQTQNWIPIFQLISIAIRHLILIDFNFLS